MSLSLNRRPVLDSAAPGGERFGRQGRRARGPTSSRRRRSTCRRSCAVKASSRLGHGRLQRRLAPASATVPAAASRGAADARGKLGKIHGTRERRRLSSIARTASTFPSFSPAVRGPACSCAAHINEEDPDPANARVTSSRAKSATCASRTAAGCASRWCSRTPTSSGCRASASRRSTGCSTTWTTWCASGCFCRRSRSSRRSSASGSPLVTLESQTPVSDFDVIAFSVVVRVGLHEPGHDAAPGEAAAARRGAQRAAIRWWSSAAP